MSKIPMIPTLVGVIAGVIGGAAYHKASSLADEVHKPKAPLVEKASVDALEDEVRRLQARVALLEVRVRLPRESDAPSPSAAPAVDPSISTDKERPDDVGPAPKGREKRDERKKRVAATIEAYWREWGAKHGLTSPQTESLTSMQVDVAKRKLDNQGHMADREMTQPEVRAANQVMTDEVRKKAQALLTADQFSQFEAENGAEFGSSYRKVREAHAKAAPVP